ncbi:hypothetical protein QR680_002027 [Steinernema hermaphroditum]|uniref:Uncharacterized protein n=1 Tax=Steinernema hermaphroditum TaxID=289476 RepID=A0AA39H0X7_9BILA|nr:hypothetical protein QR680_002027 [Steinernema hermaphroditum]
MLQSEKELSTEMIVNSLYCCRLMYVTTAAFIVTYAHLLLLTAHLAYLAARYVVDGHSLALYTHLITCVTQALFLAILYQGIKRANFVLLRLALSGLILKVIFSSAYLTVLIATQMWPIELLKHLNNFPLLRIIVSLAYLSFVVFSLFTVHRCYKYYLAIRAVIRHKMGGGRRYYNCCTNRTHFANRYAAFANAPVSDGKCKDDKSEIDTTCK